MVKHYLGHTVTQLEEAIEKVQNNYKDVTGVTATESDVRIGTKLMTSSGELKDGTLDTGEYYNSGYNDGYDKGLEDATPTLQIKTVTPSITQQTVTPDTNYDGLSKVVVNAIPQDYTDKIYNQGYEVGRVDGCEGAKTLLLLHGDTLTDSSVYSRIVSNDGVVISTNQSKFGGKSMYFNGTARLYTNGNPFNFGIGDFTVDFWVYKIQGSGGFYVSPGVTGGLMIGPNSGNNLAVGREAVAWDTNFSNIGATDNTWNHIALVRSSGTLMLFVNGKLVGSAANTMVYNMNGGSLSIGIQSKEMYGTAYSFVGYIDEYRISNVARWTSNFTPPTEPYVL